MDNDKIKDTATSILKCLQSDDIFASACGAFRRHLHFFRGCYFEEEKNMFSMMSGSLQESALMEFFAHVPISCNAWKLSWMLQKYFKADTESVCHLQF